ncbi:hypothetical protein M422DRAFT_36514 [Sphaerobolus stellatus SS14]|uniref:MARVEL domain-containing protein n=1 Tax=Sphaerobolus stellatus (strain SS14) TaxID=990650 RepID=A0A0C9TL45_SPHS4|nr:hypothetical protein M422DRAFT_36514 [Sphaerobolus stellatus SS14]
MLSPRQVSIIRLAALRTALLFSHICLGISAHLLSIPRFGQPLQGYLGLGVAVSILTLVTADVSVVVDLLRKGLIMMILWIAEAGLSTNDFSLGCSFIRNSFSETTTNSRLCSEQQALIAFSWLTWFIFLGWNVFLWTATIIAHTRGNPGVWTQSTTETDFFAPSGTSMEKSAHVRQQVGSYGSPVHVQ